MQQNRAGTSGKLASRWEQNAGAKTSTPGPGGSGVGGVKSSSPFGKAALKPTVVSTGSTAASPVKKFGGTPTASSTPVKKFGGTTTTASSTPVKKFGGTTTTTSSTPVKKFGGTTTTTTSSSTPVKKFGGTTTAASSATPVRKFGAGATTPGATATNTLNPFQKDKVLKNTGIKPPSDSTRKLRVEELKSSSATAPVAAFAQDRLKGSRQGGVLRSKSFDKETGSGIRRTDSVRRRPESKRNLLDSASSTTPSSSIQKLEEQPGTPEKALLKAALAKVTDKSLEKEIQGYIDRIKDAGGFAALRRLSVRDNDLMADMMKVISNDPHTTEIVIDGDNRFAHIKADYLLEFAQGIRTNMYLTKIKIVKVDLDNSFLSALSTSMESNIVVKEVILTDNAFTNDALLEFCMAMETNTTLVKVDLRRQRSPIHPISEDDVLESLKKNSTVQDFKLDFKTKGFDAKLESIVKKNKKSGEPSHDYNKLVLKMLKIEVERAEELYEQRKLEKEYEESELDWNYLYELSELAQKFRLTHVVMTEDDDDKIEESTSEDSLNNMVKYTDDGSFLTEEFISTYLKDEKDGTLTFAFQTQAKMFKRFPVGDQRRRFISEKFADALLAHPRQKEIMAVNMANCMCGDEWLAHFCKRCAADSTLLPKLHMLNVETNFVNEEGVVALADCIASRTTWPYLQVLRLENQRHLLSSKGELALARSLLVNRSVIRFSLRIRNMWERNQINKYISRNLDYTRQARVKHAIESGTYVERPRNEMELFFDKVAANDDSIKTVDLVGNQLFLALPEEEVVKAGAAFATNKHVKEVKMTLLKLDCNFAIAFGKSLETNDTVEKITLDSNVIAGPGIKGIFSGLSKNKSVQDLQIRHQGKNMATTEEEELISLLGDNTTLSRLGMELRSSRAQAELDRKIKLNSESRRKEQYDKSGAAKNQKPKGKMQIFFDKIANNDPTIDKVELIGDQVFMAMKSADKKQAAASFENNTFVKEVKMCNLKLDDEFGKEFGRAIASSKIIKLNLENNSIGSDGITAIVEGLGLSDSIIEASVRFQSKPLASSDEEKLPDLLSGNATLTKLGIDLRGMLPKREVDKKLAENRDLVRTRRVARSKSYDL